MRSAVHTIVTDQVFGMVPDVVLRSSVSSGGIGQHQYRKAQHHDRPGNAQQQLEMEGIGYLLDIDHQVSGKCRDSNIDEELHGQAVGLEIDPHHGAQFKIDKEQKYIFKFRVPFIHDMEVLNDTGPDDGGANDEQRSWAECSVLSTGLLQHI
jgi:hypothetical protein